MGTNSIVVNSGTITSGNAGIRDYAGALDATTVMNSGDITGDIAVRFDFYDAGTLNFDNSGTLTGISGVAVLVERQMVMVNNGQVWGDIDSLDQSDTLKNAGEIMGDISFGSGSDSLRNAGQIDGTVDMGGDADVLINSGTINGDVDLGAGTDTYRAKGDAGLEAGHAVYGGGGVDTILGGTQNDTLYGEGNNDTIKGGWGDDFVFGGDGNDTLKGGAGDDEIFGEGDNDTIYGGLGDDLIDGGLSSDTIDGGKGDDTIIGGNGSDVLIGGKDDDTLTGGNGGDTFVLSRHDGNDVITDFADGSDLIDFSVFGMGSKAAVQAAISQVDAGLMVDLSVYGGSGTVLIEGMLLADFSGLDFVY
jgi:Ca2+-binding RTX toxin-like protein